MTELWSVRSERPADLAAIHAVNAAAFGRENEALLVERLRQSPAWVAGLSLVAALDEQVIGHILFSRIHIEAEGDAVASLALAPMAVLPGWQRRGVGSALVQAGLAAAAALGWRHVIVLGHPGFYPRFGLLPASRFSIHPPFDVPDEVFMALELQPGALDGVSGVVAYPAAFDAV